MDQIDDELQPGMVTTPPPPMSTPIVPKLEPSFYEQLSECCNSVHTMCVVMDILCDCISLVSGNGGTGRLF